MLSLRSPHKTQHPRATSHSVVEATVVLKPGQMTVWGQVKERSGESRLWNSFLGEDMRPGESEFCLLFVAEEDTLDLTV